MSLALIPTDTEIKAIEYMAKNAKASKFFETLGGECAIVSMMLYAREIGVPLMQCLFGGMNSIQGKIELSPRLMNNMIRKAGHQIHIVKCDDNGCILKGIRKDTGEIYECSYSMQDAAKAGLSNKTNWKNHPSDMCFARCISRLGRRLFADVIGESYVQDEISVENEKRNYKKDHKLEDIQTLIVEPMPSEAPEKITKEQVESLMELIADDKEIIDGILSYLQLNSFEDMSQKDFDKIVKIVIKKKEKKNESELAQMAV